MACYVAHGITASRENHTALRAHITLLARISETARIALGTEDLESREVIFVHSDALGDLFLSSVCGCSTG